MSWLPLASAGIPYQFLALDPDTGEEVPGLPGSVSFNTGASVISLNPPEPVSTSTSWTLQFPGAQLVRVRVTAQGYEGRVEEPYEAAYVAYSDSPPPATIDNAADASGGIVSSFIPAQFSVDAVTDETLDPPPYVYYGSSSISGEDVPLDNSWAFLLEVWAEGPEPPVDRVDVDANERTYTASQAADTALTTWIRGLNGRVNLSAIPIEVVVAPYPRGHARLTVSATGDALGKVEWSITAKQAKQIGQGLYKIIIRRADKGELLHRGTLEVQF